MTAKHFILMKRCVPTNIDPSFLALSASNQYENQLNLEIEQLEREFLMLMLERGLKDDKLEKFGEEKEIEGCEILKEKKLEQKFLDLMLEIDKF